MENNKFVDLIAANIKVILGILIVALFIASAIIIRKDKRLKEEQQASSFLYDIQNRANPLIEKKQYREAAKLFEEVSQKYPSTRADYEAELRQGDIFLDAKMYQDAMNHYKVAERLALDNFSKVLAGYNAGAAAESAALYPDALQFYEGASAEKSAEFLRPELLMAQARCLEKLQQKDKALQIYKTVQDKYAARSYYSGAASVFEKQLSKAQ